MSSMVTGDPADPGDDGYTLLFDVWLLANSTRAVIDGALRPSGLGAEEFALYSPGRSRGDSGPLAGRAGCRAGRGHPAGQ